MRCQRYGEGRRDHEAENVREAPQESGPETEERQNHHNGDNNRVESVHAHFLGIALFR